MIKNWLLKHSKKILTITSAMAMACTYSWIGRACTTFFYQPRVPQSLLDMDKEY